MDTISHLYRKFVPIEEEVHINFVTQHQDKGGWGEQIKNVGKNDPAPLVTSQMIIGLLPYLKIERFGHLNEKISKAIKDAIQFLINSFQGSGWSDHTGGQIVVDATGAAVIAIIESLSYGIDVPGSLELTHKATQFLINQQNSEDGGWSVGSGGESKIQYTYWALKALNAYDKLHNEKKESNRSETIQRGLAWVINNFANNGSKSFSIQLSSETGAIATTYGIELLEEFQIAYDKQKVLNNYRDSQTKTGCWETQTDFTIAGKIPRRVYVFNDIPRILECLVYLDVKFDSQLFVDVLKRLKELESSDGGFKHKISDQYTIGWFTAQVLKTLSKLIVEFQAKSDRYSEGNEIVLKTKRHSFSKGVLMIGRFRPPHIGHYLGLHAILYGDENEFSLSSEVLRELINIDKVFIGIARYGIDRENPFTIGEVREIWAQIIDNEIDLKSKSNLIEIVSCPAQKDLTNVVDAIDELTYDRKSIIVISGNDRIIQQCTTNDVTAYQFKRRDTSISGREIREIISKIDFENPHKTQELLDSLQKKIHHAAFGVMMAGGFFKRAQKIINAR